MQTLFIDNMTQKFNTWFKKLALFVKDFRNVSKKQDVYGSIGFICCFKIGSHETFIRTYLTYERSKKFLSQKFLVPITLPRGPEIGKHDAFIYPQVLPKI